MLLYYGRTLSELERNGCSFFIGTTQRIFLIHRHFGTACGSVIIQHFKEEAKDARREEKEVEEEAEEEAEEEEAEEGYFNSYCCTLLTIILFAFSFLKGQVRLIKYSLFRDGQHLSQRHKLESSSILERHQQNY